MGAGSASLLLINFKSSRREAFVNGFLRGLGAPFVVYSDSHFPNSRLSKMLLLKQLKQLPKHWQATGPK